MHPALAGLLTNILAFKFVALKLVDFTLTLLAPGENPMQVFLF